MKRSLRAAFYSQERGIAATAAQIANCFSYRNAAEATYELLLFVQAIDSEIQCTLAGLGIQRII